MNEDTVLPSETGPYGATEPAADPGENTVATTEPEVTEEYEIPETMADIPTEEYVLEDSTEAVQETVSVTVEVIQAVGSDIAHTNLFGSFLICGTLIGLALLRKIHGT